MNQFFMKEEFEVYAENPNYAVSNKGQIKSLGRWSSCKGGRRWLKERILKQWLNRNGYFEVGLCHNSKTKTYRVHQLVAKVWCWHTPCGYERVVNHIDFNKKNNWFTNLEVTTQRENTNRLHLKSSSIYRGVSVIKNKTSKTKYYQSKIFIRGDAIYLGTFKLELQAADMYKKALNNKSLYDGDKNKFKQCIINFL